MVRAAVAALAASLLLTGCDFDVYKLPLPGGADVGDDPITVTAEFQDVLDLVPRSTVKVNDVSVGQVTDVALAGQHAVVTMEIQNDVDLPANSVAELRTTSLLGEKFVQLSAPTDVAPEGEIADGAEIPLDRTGRNPEVEEVLGALSLVLNGGGVAQLKTIASELNKALDGREDTARSVLDQVRRFMQQLDENKAGIVDAIDSVNQLAKSVTAQQDSIDAALDELPDALESIDQQRADLVKMLKALDRLGDVGVRVISRTKDGTIAALEQLSPVLTELANSGDDLVNSFHVFLTYPFVDEVVGRDPQVARNLHMGDYTNLSVELDLDLSGGITGLPTSLPTSLPTLLPGDLDPPAVVDLLTRCIASGDLNSEPCRRLTGSLEGLERLKTECRKPANQGALVCTALNQVPGLPVPVPSDAPSIPIVGDLLGLGRAAAGPTARSGHGPTMRQLSRAFDPALVQLLVPGMVSSR
ncbi:MCE family protein [Nocardioides sp. MAH-18]|uniref:MCE family protein n=2 Tax=Nocardioidaceae TaxID=85015 RepID=A0A6L6XTR2_9ACTN|nr:MCE family protein [Nocardioides sp. CGMCC 1.13656]MVQ50579.1 MCE family protein [Nocardioides sp. MAH-18]